MNQRVGVFGGEVQNASEGLQVLTGGDQQRSVVDSENGWVHVVEAHERENHARPIGDAVHHVLVQIKKGFELAHIGYAEGSLEVRL